jgi:hypothetical protein
MAGYTGEKRWRDGMNPEYSNGGVSEAAKEVCKEMLDALTNAEAAYAEMAELYQYAGGTIQGLADLLFTEDIAARTSPGTNAVITVDVPQTKAQIDFGTDAGGIVDSVSIVDGGAGYLTGGTFNISVASDSGWVAGTLATITYTVAGGAIDSVTVTDGGDGYSASLPATTDVAASDIPQPTNTAITAAAISVAGTGYTDGNYQLSSVQAPENGNGILNYTVSGGVVTAVSVAKAGLNYEPGTGKTVVNFPLAGVVSETTANADEVAKAQAAFDAITALHELYLAADNNVVAQEDRLAQIRRMT